MGRCHPAVSILSLCLLASAVSAEQYTGSTTAVWLESSSLPISSSFNGQQSSSITNLAEQGSASRTLLQTRRLSSIVSDVVNAVKGASTAKTPPPVVPPPPPPPPPPALPSPAVKAPSTSPAKSPSPSPVIIPVKSPSPVAQPSPSPTPKAVPQSPAPISPLPSPSPSPLPPPSSSPVPSPSPSPSPSPTVVAEPITTLPGEVLPDALQKNTSSSNPVVMLTETVAVTMVLKGVRPSDLAGLLDSTTAVTATLSGTNAAQWLTSNSTLPMVALTGSRKLQQQLQQDVAINLAIVTTNPQLVVFRLSQAPLPASAAAVQASSPAGSSSSVQGNCKIEYCLRLAAAGIPVDTAFGIKVTPVYDFSTSSSNADTAAAVAARDADLAKSRIVGVAVGVSVAVAVVVSILLCNARRILACWRNRAASKQKAAENDSAAADWRNRWQMLSWTGAAAATPTSNAEAGAASATGGAAGTKNAISSTGAKKASPASWLARVSVGSGASQSSSAIGTLPITSAVPAKPQQQPQVPEHGQQETLDVASYWDDQHETSSTSHGGSSGHNGNRSMSGVFRKSSSFRRPASHCGAVGHASVQSSAVSDVSVQSAPSVGYSQGATAVAVGDDWHDCKSDPGSDNHV